MQPARGFYSINLCSYHPYRNIEKQTILFANGSVCETITRKLHYIKPCIEKQKMSTTVVDNIRYWTCMESAHNSCRQLEIKLSRKRIRHTRLTNGHLMSKNDQQSTCTNAAYRNQRLNNQSLPPEIPE